MLSVKSRKQILYNRLNDLLKPKGYKLIVTGEDPLYLLKGDEGVDMLILNFLRRGSVELGLFRSIDEIEDIILDIVKSNLSDKSIYLERKKYFLPTFYDVRLKNIKKDRFDTYFETEEEFIKFLEWLCVYLKTTGIPFLKHYSFLPNNLAKINLLENDSKYANEILFGGPEWFFRYLMISKLCLDNKFEERLSYVDGIFYDDKYKLEDWLPYYSSFQRNAAKN